MENIAVNQFVRETKGLKEVTVSQYQEVRGEGGEEFTVYVVEVETNDGNRRFIQKRFNEFAELYEKLRVNYEAIGKFSFPSKSVWKKSQKTKEHRVKKFDQLMSMIMDLPPDFRSGGPPMELFEFIVMSNERREAIKRHALHGIARVVRPADGDHEAIRRLLFKPTMLLKFGRRGDPHWRKFQLVQAAKGLTLQWESAKRANKRRPPEVLCASMERITFGKRTQTFERHRMPHLERLAFSIWYQISGAGGMRVDHTLDLVCKHPDEYFVWTNGLERIIEQNAGRNKGRQESGGSVESKDSTAEEADDEDEDDDADEDEEGDGDGDGDGDEDLVTTGNVVYSWGFGGWGQLGDTDDLADIRERNHGRHSVATNTGCPVMTLAERNEDIRMVAAGGQFTLAVTREGQCHCWGHMAVCNELSLQREDSQREFGQQNVVRRGDHVLLPAAVRPLFERPIKEVAAGEMHCLFVDFHGAVFASGINDQGQLGLGHTDDVGQPTAVDFPAITTDPHSHGSAAEHKQPEPLAGVAGPRSALSPETVVSVACGYNTSCAITKSGVLFTWGEGTAGQLGHNDDANRTSPTVVQSLREESWKVNSVSCGQFHTACLAELLPPPAGSPTHAAYKSPQVSSKVRARFGSAMDEGQVRDLAKEKERLKPSVVRLLTWGWGGCGQLGQGEVDDQFTPTVVEMLRDDTKYIEQVACGAAHTVAIVNVRHNETLIQGQLWAWGAGVPSTGNIMAPHIATPKPVSLQKRGHQLLEAYKVVCGDAFTAVLDADGEVTIIGQSPCAPTDGGANAGAPRPSSVQAAVVDNMLLEMGAGEIPGIDGLVTDICAGGRHVAALLPKRFTAASAHTGVQMLG